MPDGGHYPRQPRYSKFRTFEPDCLSSMSTASTRHRPSPSSHCGPTRFDLVLRLLLTVTILAVITSKYAIAAEITSSGPSRWAGFVSSIKISGQIEQGDDVVFRQVAAGRYVGSVYLYTLGGDVRTALALGRLIRSEAGEVVAVECSSACVFLYAGGNRRRASYIGVHRLYYATLKAGLSREQVQSDFSGLLEEARAFLVEMNVAPELLSLMQSVPPEDNKKLSYQDLFQYGLGHEDPVYEERYIANTAGGIGISSFEYRQRAKTARVTCERSYPRVEQTNALEDCVDGAIRRISPEAYRQKFDLARNACLHFADEAFRTRDFSLTIVCIEKAIKSSR